MLLTYYWANNFVWQSQNNVFIFSSFPYFLLAPLIPFAVLHLMRTRVWLLESLKHHISIFTALLSCLHTPISCHCSNPPCYSSTLRRYTQAASFPWNKYLLYNIVQNIIFRQPWGLACGLLGMLGPWVVLSTNPGPGSENGNCSCPEWENPR